VARQQGKRSNELLLGIDASRATRARRTGTEGYAYHLIRELIPLAGQRGHGLRLYYNQAPAPDLFPAAEHVETVHIPFPRLWTHVRLGWELRQRQPDVFFTPAHVIPLTFRGPAVATVHDLGYHHFPQAHTRFQVAYLHWSTRHNVRRSRQILADSRATRQDLIHFYDVPPQKVTVVYPGVDPSLAPVTDEQVLARVRKQYGINRPYMLYLGTLQPRKNLQRLVEAYVASDVPHQLVLAGKAGWLAQPILDTIFSHQSPGTQQAASTLEPSAPGLQAPISDRIHITGYVAEADKAALLSGATALLFPSLYEGFGFPVLEAQACGTPVLSADNSSMPEIANDSALLVDAQDTGAIGEGIRRLAEDEALRERLVQAGKKNAGRFTWRRAARQALALLEEATT
jgi:glycosyltransferase involved in cell wall biosynthesis